MQALVEAVMRRDALQERLRTLGEAAEEQRARLCRPETMPGAERWITQGYLDGLVQDMHYTKQQLVDAENHVDGCHTTLVERAKERGLLDSLREKQAERHLQQEGQQELKTNDETATLRYKPAAV